MEEKTNTETSPSPLSGGIEVPSRYLRPPQGSCHDSCKRGHDVWHPKMEAKENTDILTSPLNGYIDVLSRYMRPPHGSCHDLCKDGLEHDCKDKKERPFFPKLFRNNPLPNGESNQLIFMTAQKRKQKPVLLTVQQRRQKSELIAVQRRRQKLELLTMQRRRQKSKQITVQQRRQKSELMTVQRKRQKSEPKQSKTPRQKAGVTDEVEINGQMDFPPERIDRTSSPTSDVAEGSVLESSSLKLSTPNDQKNNAYLEHSEESVDTANGDHELANPSKGMYLEIATELDMTAIHNDVIEEHLPTTKEGGSTEEPDSIKSIIPSTIVANIASPEYKVENTSQGSSADRMKVESVEAFPLADNVVRSDDCQTSNKGESSNELADINKTLPESSEGPSSLNLENHEGKVSAKKRSVGPAELASKNETSTMEASTDEAGFFQEHIQLKNSCIHDNHKTKRELNKLKNGIKEDGVANKRIVVRKKEDTSAGPKLTKKNSSLRKTMKSKLETEQECSNSSIARITTRAVIVDGSAQPASFLKLKKFLANSWSPAIYSRGLSGRRNQEKMHKVKDKLNGDGVALASINLRKHRKVMPTFTMNTQSKAAKLKFRAREKISGDSEADVEKLDLKALRQKLRRIRSIPGGKIRSSLERKEENGKSGPQFGSVTERVSHREVPQRACRDLPKSEMNSSRSVRTTRLNSQDKVGSFRKLTFRRGKVVNLQPAINTPPVRLKFRRSKSAKDIGMTSSRNKMESGVGGSNTSPSRSIKVVLKHKGANNNKNGKRRSSSNHVLEETATKLAEARQSKVKALVGAFETVISLQETKVESECA